MSVWAMYSCPPTRFSLEPRPAALIVRPRLRPEVMSFDGLAEVDPGIPGVEVIGQLKRQPFKEIESWQDLLKGWQTSLETLAANFVHGGRPKSIRAARPSVAIAICKACAGSANASFRRTMKPDPSCHD